MNSFPASIAVLFATSLVAACDSKEPPKTAVSPPSKAIEATPPAAKTAEQPTPQQVGGLPGVAQAPYGDKDKDKKK